VVADDPATGVAFGFFFLAFVGGGAAAAGTSCERSLATASQSKHHTSTNYLLTYLLLSA